MIMIVIILAGIAAPVITPYDPTQQAEPDVTLSAEERGIGGLGILMAKKSMDGVEIHL